MLLMSEGSLWNVGIWKKLLLWSTIDMAHHRVGIDGANQIADKRKATQLDVVQNRQKVLSKTQICLIDINFIP